MLVKIGEYEDVQYICAKQVKVNLDEPYGRRFIDMKDAFELIFSPAKLIEMMGDGKEYYALFRDDEQAIEFKLRYT